MDFSILQVKHGFKKKYLAKANTKLKLFYAKRFSVE